MHFEHTATVWRIPTKSKEHPEQLVGNKWVSDFGYGDYFLDKAAAKVVLRHSNVGTLPGRLPELVKTANIQESKLLNRQRKYASKSLGVRKNESVSKRIVFNIKNSVKVLLFKFGWMG